MASINIFSQRNMRFILKKEIEVSIYSKHRASIYNLFKKYNDTYMFEDTISKTLDELLIYKDENQKIDGKSIKDVDLEYLMKYDYPSTTLDAIEIFSNFINNDDFVTDINNYFYNNEIPYRLENNQIVIEDKIKIPDTTNNQIDVLKKDIETNIIKKQYTLVLDRLHTYYGYKLMEYANALNIPYSLDSNNHISYSATNKSIAKTLKDNGLISEFEETVIKMTYSILGNFNDIRNHQSFAHSNNIITEKSAEFIVKILSANLILLEKCVYNK